MSLRHEAPNILADTLYSFDASVQISALRRRFPGNQLSSNYNGTETRLATYTLQSITIQARFGIYRTMTQLYSRGDFEDSSPSNWLRPIACHAAAVALELSPVLL
jgi:hypothetical protein